MKILFYGNFGIDGQTISNGQSSKTNNFFKCTKYFFPEAELIKFNTFHFKRNFVVSFLKLKKAISLSDVIVIFPGSVNSLNVFRIAYKKSETPFLYPVVGGWVGDKISKRKKLISFLKKAYRIYPETLGLSHKLNALSILNTKISPTFSLIFFFPWFSKLYF